VILQTLEINHFRILESVKLDLHPALNLITGNNGSGKSSVLEAVQCLATGHSYRTRKPKELINHKQESYRLLSVFNDKRSDRIHRAGLERFRNGVVNSRLDFEDVARQSEITKLLPVKVLTPDSHELVTEAPETRRKYLDWGLFHVEPLFHDQWKNYRRALSQRNVLLRENASNGDIATWNAPLAESATAIDRFRHHYIQELYGYLKDRLGAMDLRFHVELVYKPGWDTTMTLDEQLSKNLDNHRRMKTTTDGPHRADVAIISEGVLARQVLSRGEQKVIAYALHLAQLDVLNKRTNNNAIVLCDDLRSELDLYHSTALIEQLMAMDGQIILTGVNLDVFDDLSCGRFHMKHGCIETDYNQALPT